MLIISIKDKENNKWKKKKKKKKKKKTKKKKKKKKKKKAKKKKIRGMEAIVKEWEINDFVERLSYALSN